MTQVLGPLHQCGRLRGSSWLLALDWCSSGQLGSELSDGRPLSLFLSISVTLTHNKEIHFLKTFHILNFLIVLKIHLFIYLQVELQTERRAREKERGLPSDVHSLIDCNCQSCADLKPGARSQFQVSQMGTGAQGLGSSSTTLPGHSREQDQKWSS